MAGRTDLGLDQAVADHSSPRQEIIGEVLVAQGARDDNGAGRDERNMAEIGQAVADRQIPFPEQEMIGEIDCSVEQGASVCADYHESGEGGDDLFLADFRLDPPDHQVPGQEEIVEGIGCLVT